MQTIPNTNTHVIYSAVFGNYDSIITPKYLHKKTDYLLFTDCIDTKRIPEPWQAVHVDWFDTVDIKYRNRRAARHFKALPHLYMPQHTVSIWMDMTHDVVMDPRAIEEKFLSKADIALFKHELRNCVYAEGSLAIKYKLDHIHRIKLQLQWYKAVNYQPGRGLWETPGMVRRNTNVIAKANNTWWEMMCRFSSRDQISLPYVLEKYGVKPHVLPGYAGKCSQANNNIIRQIQDHTYGHSSDQQIRFA